MYLKEIDYPYTGDIPANEKYIFNLPKLSLRDFIQQEDKMFDDQLRIIESKMPAIEGESIERKRVRASVEQVYEWE